MARLVLLIYFLLVVSASAIAAPSTSELSAQCYTSIGPLLKSSGGVLTPAVRDAFLRWSETIDLVELRQNSETVSQDCLDEVRRDPILRDAMFGAIYPPDPSILQNYAQLREKLGPQFMSKYRSLVIAVSVAKRTKGVEPAGTIGKDYQEGFWTDESLQTPGSDDDKKFAQLIADFMKKNNVTAIDVYHDANIQQQLRTYLAQNSVSNDRVNLVQTTVQFGDRLKYVMVLLGLRPGARDPKPDIVDWLHHLASVYETVPPSTPTDNGSDISWPLFPDDTAPWPLLMPLAHPVPLTEADFIWNSFEGNNGSDRFHTYGPYRNDGDEMPYELQPSKWFWDAWPDRIQHGGECVNISKGTVDFYSSLGKPAMWAGQPGHSNLITFEQHGTEWTATIEQDFAGGPENTSAQWYFDEDTDGMLHFRDLYNWPSAEHQLGLARAMNIGLTPYIDTRIALNIFRTLPESDKPTLGIALLRCAVAANKYNPDIWFFLGKYTADPEQATALVEAARVANPSVYLGYNPSAPTPIDMTAAEDTSGYWQTTTKALMQYTTLLHSIPKTENAMYTAYSIMKMTSSVGTDDLVSFGEKFSTSDPVDNTPDQVQFDYSLAQKGDSFGELRMGQRYSDGYGVAPDPAAASNYLAASASQYDLVAATILQAQNPIFPENLIMVKASSVYGPGEAVEHLIDDDGLAGVLHDADTGATTMWQSVENPPVTTPAAGIAPSPAWVRFTFTQPVSINSILIWNHNQQELTDRGFRRTHIYGLTQNSQWTQLTKYDPIGLPEAPGVRTELPTRVVTTNANIPVTSVVIAADPNGGNYGSTCYGLSAVHFCVQTLDNVLPSRDITVTASSVYGSGEPVENLINGAGMTGALHDSQYAAATMWQSVEHPAVKSPAASLSPSPAWVRFDFSKPTAFKSMLIWNGNQPDLTDRCFRQTHIYGTIDGKTWMSITAQPTLELPRLSGTNLELPTEIQNAHPESQYKAVIIAADETDGNYGSDCYILSAVRFVHGN